ncbi:MAG: hypothetical protein AAF243_06235, partial [Cyanobacteria bacterium P01_A01_bin.137]
VTPQLESESSDDRDFAQAHQWVSLAYLHPERAAQQLAIALANTFEQQPDDLLRIASIVEALERPLANYPNLLTYARGMAKYARGSIKAAQEEFDRIRQSDNLSELSTKGLPIPQTSRTKVQIGQKHEKSKLPLGIQVLASIILGGITSSAFWLTQMQSPTEVTVIELSESEIETSTDLDDLGEVTKPEDEEIFISKALSPDESEDPAPPQASIEPQDISNNRAPSSIESEGTPLHQSQTTTQNTSDNGGEKSNTPEEIISPQTSTDSPNIIVNEEETLEESESSIDTLESPEEILEANPTLETETLKSSSDVPSDGENNLEVRGEAIGEGLDIEEFDQPSVLQPEQSSAGLAPDENLLIEFRKIGSEGFLGGEGVDLTSLTFDNVNYRFTVSFNGGRNRLFRLEEVNASILDSNKREMVFIENLGGYSNNRTKDFLERDYNFNFKWSPSDYHNANSYIFQISIQAMYDLGTLEQSFLYEESISGKYIFQHDPNRHR